MAKVADGIRYAERVVAGEIVAGEFVRLACQRFLDDLKYGEERGIYFSEPRAQHILNFYKFVPHVKGALAGQTDKFASNNFSCNNTFGVADPVSHFCHQSLAFKSSASGSTSSGPAVFTFARLAGDIPNSASIARIRFQASAFIAAAGCALISTSPFCVSVR